MNIEVSVATAMVILTGELYGGCIEVLESLNGTDFWPEREFGNARVPIVTIMDFGHTDPQIILPLGVKAEVDCSNRTFKLSESPLK